MKNFTTLLQNIRLKNRILFVLTITYGTISKCDKSEEIDHIGVSYEIDQTIMNWSSTHSCRPKKIYTPSSVKDLVRLLQHGNSKKLKLRPIGNALSPNGIGMNSSDDDCLISMCNIDKISVDTRNQTVAVGAGAKVSSVLHELKKHKLTLENFSSIQEQQIGGWTQVAAHGTGCSLSTVDDMIVEMKIATPTNGIMTLSRSQNNWIFDMCKVGLGNLGVVVEVTLKCIPEVNLKEETFVVTRDEIRKLHYARLQKYRHLRYMWIPYSQYVVVVASNPFESTSLISEENRSHCGNDATKPLVELAREVRPDLEEKYLNSLSFAVLRDILLDVNPLDVSYVQRINNLEAQFWINSSGSRIDDSTNILGFDCGGEQFVLELCFPIGPLEERSEKDVEFVESLLNKAESALLPIPSPIEQRWTSSSSSKMSPAYSPDKTQIYSWVGIIMYVPPSYQSFEQRNLIRIKFNDYCSLIEPILEKFNAVPHWAKVESPLQPINPNKDMDALLRLRTRLRKRYDVDGYNQLRISLDPCDILSNNLINILMPLK